MLQPEEKIIKKFETMLLGRQRTVFNNIVKEIDERVNEYEQGGAPALGVRSRAI